MNAYRNQKRRKRKMLNLIRKPKKPTNYSPIFFSQIFTEELTTLTVNKGDFVEHARFRKLFVAPGCLAGEALIKHKKLYFVASNREVIKHIEREGMVPLLQNRSLRFFKDKRRMNRYIAKTNPLT
jgi:hypothetical protein